MDEGPAVALRPVTEEDFAVLFEQQSDPVAYRRAAFGAEHPADRAEFLARSHRARLAPDTVWKVVVIDGRVVGEVARFPLLGHPSIAYWIDRQEWGRGIATRAVRLFLEAETLRPLFARVAADNVASRRVLEKCGFVDIDGERSYAPARGEVIEERIYRLDAGSAPLHEPSARSRSP